MALPKHSRLKGKKEFAELFSATRPLSSAHLLLRVSRNAADVGHRFAVIVPAKNVPLASARNKFRRRISGAVSDVIRNREIAPGTRAVVSLRSAPLPVAGALRQELLSLMEKSGILSQ